jgi:hypothetical protein
LELGESFENITTIVRESQEEQLKNNHKGRRENKMSGKYAFSQTLKEVRFLFCQTAEHSGLTR